jgi:hypothetical protein
MPHYCRPTPLQKSQTPFSHFFSATKSQQKPNFKMLVKGVEINQLEGWLIKINSKPSLFGKKCNRRWFKVVAEVSSNTNKSNKSSNTSTSTSSNKSNVSKVKWILAYYTTKCVCLFSYDKLTPLLLYSFVLFLFFCFFTMVCCLLFFTTVDPPQNLVDGCI